MARLRLGCHHLRIERDRYNGTAREDRQCWFHWEVEDEYHALMVCHIVEDERQQLWKRLREEEPTLVPGDDDRKVFQYLISPPRNMIEFTVTFVAAVLKKAWRRDRGYPVGRG